MTTDTNDCRPAGRNALPAPPPLDCSANCALFLDFDGTLVDIAPQPDAIAVDPALPGLLDALSTRLDGRLAIVSGRAVADLDRHLGKLDVAYAGSHGGEFRPSGSDAVELLAPPLPREAEDEVRDFVSHSEGLLAEAKPLGIAMHYRAAPAREDAVLELASELSARLGLEMKRGKMVVELLTPGSDKGSAVARFMDMEQFRDATPLFLGDDVTDEDAFEIVREHGGTAILVGEERESAAGWRLSGVGEVHRWLKAALA
ncbi:trehalose 6-phosphate phosphatase [Novosphingobium marinum]|uniref:Trehalose 6-phosphate phosphatase n=1 Tax=Novosphingobium marinum TaxID=1514948 RepID=A0A7Z0BUA3_9SPHN|nr:trehalose-phosphatase [Novosphingobium marinum]NYH96049.1 trehalose 6-phosphate phosphatase [Novosphingobium marinum]GGC32030.1 trehalose 6-phosphate phosphatase [Novosphingobium marinum]